jgi:hypothetical protein
MRLADKCSVQKKLASGIDLIPIGGLGDAGPVIETRLFS